MRAGAIQATLGCSTLVPLAVGDTGGSQQVARPPLARPSLWLKSGDLTDRQLDIRL